MRKRDPTSRGQRDDESSTISWARYASCLKVFGTLGALVSVMMTCMYVHAGMAEKHCRWAFA